MSEPRWLDEKDPRCAQCSRWVVLDDRESWTIAVGDTAANFLHTTCANRDVAQWEWRHPRESVWRQHL